jgi:hypothetical protein
MSESEKSSWDKERVKEIIDKAVEEILPNMKLKEGTVEGFQCYKDMVELLGSVRAEAIGWTWSEACSQHARGLDPRKFEVPLLMDKADADLNPERDK